MIYIRICTYVIGLLIFSFGITLSIQMQYLGIHPWDVLSVGLFEKIGLTIGSWNIIIGFFLILVAFILDKSYIKVGTFTNAILVGVFVDFYMWTGLLPVPTNAIFDIFVMMIGIVLMGFGGGLYNAAQIGAGPRDGFMLSISDKVGMSIGKVRIITECTVLVIGFLIGGPIFIFTFIFTFIQSPIFQYSYEYFNQFLGKVEVRVSGEKARVYKNL
ncbi:MAG TPA: YitT family protein [Candidatus Pseudogracilibacillus intestinigallinarum]|uniref:YitT family protein n=1 Tax=Candidatus Pseudogracilibacillus intestinigallinarum TaxID=2838742 RepID=A0A9D1PN03_9BACI|nr:YitT family protein [Candidatus Pseudogracilibacillus intestinigallinarum]